MIQTAVFRGTRGMPRPESAACEATVRIASYSQTEKELTNFGRLSSKDRALARRLKHVDAPNHAGRSPSERSDSRKEAANLQNQRGTFSARLRTLADGNGHRRFRLSTASCQQSAVHRTRVRRGRITEAQVYRHHPP